MVEPVSVGRSKIPIGRVSFLIVSYMEGIAAGAVPHHVG